MARAVLVTFSLVIYLKAFEVLHDVIHYVVLIKPFVKW